MHLLAFYWSGLLPLGEAALDRFYHNASARIRGAVTREVGRIFSQDTEIELQTRNRLMTLCEQRLNAGSISHGAVDTAKETDLEIIEFASWFEITALPADWRLDRLRQLLEVVDRVDPGNFSLEFLAKEVPEHLGRVMRCFLLFSEKLLQEAYISTGRNAAKSILKAGLTSSDVEIHDSAIRARDNLLLAERFEL